MGAVTRGKPVKPMKTKQVIEVSMNPIPFIVGRCVEAGDDDTGQPYLLIHTTREQIIANRNLVFADVRVSLAPPDHPIMNTEDQPITPDRLAHEYVVDHKRSMMNTYSANVVSFCESAAFLAGYQANAERNAADLAHLRGIIGKVHQTESNLRRQNADIAQARDLAEEALRRHGFELATVVDVLTWVPTKEQLAARDLRRAWEIDMAAALGVRPGELLVCTALELRRENAALKTAAADYAQAAEASAALVEKLTHEVTAARQSVSNAETFIRAMETQEIPPMQAKLKSFSELVTAAHDPAGAARQIERLTAERDAATKFYSHQWSQMAMQSKRFEGERDKAREENERLKNALSRHDCSSGVAPINECNLEWRKMVDSLRAELSAAREELASVSQWANQPKLWKDNYLALKEDLSAANAAREKAEIEERSAVDSWHSAIRERESLKVALEKERAKLEFLEGKGLTVGLMTTSDQAEPYLAYSIEPDSELSDTRILDQLTDAEADRDCAREMLEKERAEVARLRECLDPGRAAAGGSGAIQAFIRRNCAGVERNSGA